MILIKNFCELCEGLKDTFMGDSGNNFQSIGKHLRP